MSALLTVEEAAKYLSVSTDTVYRQAKAKENPLPHVKIGRSIRFTTEGLDLWIQANTVTGDTTPPAPPAPEPERTTRRRTKCQPPQRPGYQPIVPVPRHL